VGEILALPGLLGAAVGGVLSLLWLRERARVGAVVGVVAALVFALFASFGLPINTRYAFLIAAILAVFFGAGVLGWTLLPRGDSRRRVWMACSAVVVLVLVAWIPRQYRGLHSTFVSLDRQQRIQNDLVDLVGDRAISLRCGPIGVQTHAPVPLLALVLKTRPSSIVSAEIAPITRGTAVLATPAVARSEYLVDLADHPGPLPMQPPAGFSLVRADASWRIYSSC
jgi:hypothetical protein